MSLPTIRGVYRSPSKEDAKRLASLGFKRFPLVTNCAFPWGKNGMSVLFVMKFQMWVAYTPTGEYVNMSLTSLLTELKLKGELT